LSRDLNKFKEINSQMNHFSVNNFNIDESRSSLPAWTFRDKDIQRFDFPLKPNVVHIPFKNNLQTRILEKDYYTSNYY
jgi:hypothetical protein